MTTNLCFSFYLFCSPSFVEVSNWSPLPVCARRKLHGEMGEPHHVLRGQRVCSGCLISHTQTHTQTPTLWPKKGVQCVPANSRGAQSAIHTVVDASIRFQPSLACKHRHHDAFIVSCHFSALIVWYLELFISCRGLTAWNSGWKHLSSSSSVLWRSWRSCPDIYTENGK